MFCIFSNITQCIIGDYRLSEQTGPNVYTVHFMRIHVKEPCDLSIVSSDDNTINKAPYISFYKTLLLSADEFAWQILTDHYRISSYSEYKINRKNRFQHRNAITSLKTVKETILHKIILYKIISLLYYILKYIIYRFSKDQ